VAGAHFRLSIGTLASFAQRHRLPNSRACLTFLANRRPVAGGGFADAFVGGAGVALQSPDVPHSVRIDRSTLGGCAVLNVEALSSGGVTDRITRAPFGELVRGRHGSLQWV